MTIRRHHVHGVIYFCLSCHRQLMIITNHVLIFSTIRKFQDSRCYTTNFYEVWLMWSCSIMTEFLLVYTYLIILSRRRSDSMELLELVCRSFCRVLKDKISNRDKLRWYLCLICAMYSSFLQNGRNGTPDCGCRHSEDDGDEGLPANSRRISCRKCGKDHAWISTNKTKLKARWCQVRSIRLLRNFIFDVTPADRSWYWMLGLNTCGG